MHLVYFHLSFLIPDQKGLGGLYKGVTATIMKQGSNQAIRFFVMETMKDRYRQYRGDQVSGLPVPKPLTGLFGIVAGAASVYGNTPLDVVKTRMQVSSVTWHLSYPIIIAHFSPNYKRKKNNLLNSAITYGLKSI